MSEHDFIKGYKILSSAYNREITPDDLKIWYQFFKEEKEEDFSEAIKRLVTKNKFFPSVAELKKEIRKINTQDFHAEEEFERVMKAIRFYGRYRKEEAMESLPSITQKTVRLLGGFQRLCESTSRDWLRKNFIDTFNNTKDFEEEDYMNNQPYLSLTELKKRYLENKSGSYER